MPSTPPASWPTSRPSARLPPRDNGKGLTSWHGVLWMPHVRGLLLCVPQATAYTVASAQPGRDADDTNPVRGWVTAMAGDDRWLYAALYTIAGDTWLLAGREATTEEDAAWGRMVWHPLARLEGKKGEAMHLSSSGTNPRLWFGVGADVGYITLPRYGDNPRHDANCRYATSGRMYYSSACWDVPTTTKVFKSIEFVTEHLSPTRYLDVYYRLDGREWVRAGRAIASPQYAISLGTQGVAGKRIEIRLDYASGGTHTPAVVKAIVVRAAERAEQVDVITFVVRCADRLPLNTGGVCPRSGAAILAELKALATMPTAVPLRDVVGLTRQVLVLPPVQEQEVERQAGEPREVLATVRAVAFAVPDTEWVTFQFAISGSSGGMDIPADIPWAIGASTRPAPGASLPGGGERAARHRGDRPGAGHGHHERDDRQDALLRGHPDRGERKLHHRPGERRAHRGGRSGHRLLGQAGRRQ